MADFNIAYEKFVKPFEGGYVNNPNDKGGETYAGIARKFNPKWKGWDFIDFKKRTKPGEVKTNAFFPDIDYLVVDFYKSLWNRHKLSEIKSQDVANIFFDFIVNSGTRAIKKVQKLLKIKDDGIIGNQTINAINNENPAKLNNEIKKLRKNFYKNIVLRDPSQNVFAQGWKNRINAFPTLPTSGITTVLLFIAILYLLYLNK
jgi:lysozyme family protein